MEMEMEFKECSTCAAKPGTPTLCDGCLHNRVVIGRLNSNPWNRIVENLKPSRVRALENIEDRLQATIARQLTMISHQSVHDGKLKQKLVEADNSRGRLLYSLQKTKQNLQDLCEFLEDSIKSENR